MMSALYRNPTSLSGQKQPSNSLCANFIRVENVYRSLWIVRAWLLRYTVPILPVVFHSPPQPPFPRTPPLPLRPLSGVLCHVSTSSALSRAVWEMCFPQWITCFWAAEPAPKVKALRRQSYGFHDYLLSVGRADVEACSPPLSSTPHPPPRSRRRSVLCLGWAGLRWHRGVTLAGGMCFAMKTSDGLPSLRSCGTRDDRHYQDSSMFLKVAS